MSEIVKSEGVLGGKARLDGRRISVYQIGEMYLEGGFSPEDIADQLDLTLAEVHLALSYYYDHPNEMAEIREKQAEVTERLADETKKPETLSQ